ncbi:hypothetical protein L1987_77905 [Smallanthus sonchifolius]|uniref:Uncharacterized protein n=1 Tax=Smallanthus sonchifolius TaxID=185202 RepID=A0ACB8ZBN6_9ASTR|nr:hypothetical protein L1987_77905 [Smallanthus sonchifolius]
MHVLYGSEEEAALGCVFYSKRINSFISQDLHDKFAVNGVLCFSVESTEIDLTELEEENLEDGDIGENGESSTKWR